MENLNKNVIERTSPLEQLSRTSDVPDTATLNESLDDAGDKFKEFGIEECSQAAKEIFTPEVVESWATLSAVERSDLAKKYAAKVAESFDLKDYKGIVYEPMEGKHGRNLGDGVARLNSSLLGVMHSPLQLVDTVTHELRHQYQRECIKGLHPTAPDIKAEWTEGLKIYTDKAPWALDPYGYKYNPLETDARNAGTLVVSNLTQHIIGNRHKA